MSTVIMSAVFTYFFMSLSYFYGFEFFWREESDDQNRRIEKFFCFYICVYYKPWLSCKKNVTAVFIAYTKFDFRRKVT